MTDRSRGLALVVILVLFLAAVLLLRQAVRSLAEPLATLERFASAPRPPASETEQDFKELVRTIDWDEPPAPAPAAPRKPKAKPAKRASLTVEKVLLSEYAGKVEAHQGRRVQRIKLVTSSFVSNRTSSPFSYHPVPTNEL